MAKKWILAKKKIREIDLSNVTSFFGPDFLKFSGLHICIYLFFLGFRKVKRIKCNFSEAFKFDACGFLDPYIDCSQSDKDLWIKSRNDTKLDKENAKMILLRAGDEFCNMVKTENDLITKYKSEIGASVIWKR